MRIFRLDVLLLFAVLALFAGFAYLTQNPDSPWLEKAMEWPAVGGLAGRFRTAYLGPEPGEEMAAEPEEPEEEEPLRIFVDGSVRRPPATRPTPRAKSPAPERQSAPPPAERPLRHRLPRGPLPGLRRPRREPQAVPEADGHRRRGPGPLLPPLALGRASGGADGLDRRSDPQARYTVRRSYDAAPGEGIMRINARLDEDRTRKLEFLLRATERSISETIKRAIDLLYERVRRSRPRPAEIFSSTGFIGSGEAAADLSETYKEALREDLEAKHGDR